MSEVPASSPLDAARAALDAARAQLSSARGDVNAANAALSAVRPEEHETPAAYAKALKSARTAVQSAEDAIRFHEAKVVASESALEPLELQALREDVRSQLAECSVWVSALTLFLSRVIERMPDLREALKGIRDSQGAAERAWSELERRGAKPERLPEDEVVAFCTRHVQENLESPSDALAALLAISKFIEGAPGREAERAEAKRRDDLDRQRAYEEEALRGVHGEAEKERVRKERKASMEKFYGPRGPAHVMTSVKGTLAHAELDRARKATGLA